MKLVAITRRLAFAAFAGALAATPAVAQQRTYDGDWEGVLEAPNGAKLRLALHVKTEGAETKAVLDSLDQGASIPATAVKMDGGELQILFLPIMGELKGKLSQDGTAIEASWSQGATLPLRLLRKAAK